FVAEPLGRRSRSERLRPKALRFPSTCAIMSESSRAAQATPANPMTEQAGRVSFRIRDLPSEERPRERLARVGAAALSSEELLSLLLGSGCRGESALDFARRILARHGGLAGLAGLSGPELRRERGIKHATGS